MTKQEAFPIECHVEVCDGVPPHHRAMKEGVEIIEHGWGEEWRKDGRSASIELRGPNAARVEYLTYNLVEVTRGQVTAEQPAFYALQAMRIHTRDEAHRHCLDWCSRGVIPKSLLAD